MRSKSSITTLIVLIFLAVACNLTVEEEAKPSLATPPFEIQEPVSAETESSKAAPAQAESPPSEVGESSPESAVADKWSLWVDGPHLRGVDLHPCILFTVEGCTQPITRQDIQDLRDLGANLVNASYPGVFTENAPYEVNSTALAYLDDLVGWAEEVGLYVVIHFRTGPGRNEGAITLEGNPRFDVWSDQAAHDAWVEMWRFTAERYRDNPVVVGYDLMVEPHPNTLFDPEGTLEPLEFQAQVEGTLMDWNAFAAEITAAIRQVDPDTPIIINSLNWASAAWFPALQPTGDPHTVYSLHAYDPDVYVVQEEGEATISYPDVVDDYGEMITFDRAWLDENYRPIREFAQQHNVPIYVGEFGAVRWVPDAAAFLHDQTDLFEQYGWNYAIYVWRGDEPDFDGFNMEYGPDPANHTLILNNPLLGVLRDRWAQNVDFPVAISSPGEATSSTPAITFAHETRPDGAFRLTETSSGASDQNPAFSPEGTRLLFTRFENGYNDGPSALYLLDLDSGEVSLITAAPDSDNVNLPGSSWNPATGRITFASDREDSDEVWTIAADGSDLFRVTDHAMAGYFIEPSFSPDGQWIVFEFDDNVPDDQQQGSIWKVHIDDAELIELTDGPGSGVDDRQPNWSPGGDRILFQRRVPGSEDWNLYTMAPDGSDVRQVTTAPASDTDASWSPDSRWIVYSSDHGGLPVPNIFAIPANGGEPVRVTHDETNEDGAPSWSPDGRWIAFESHPGQDEDTPSALWLIDAPAIEQEAVTTLSVDNNRTPSNTRLADVSHWLYLIDVDLELETVDQIAASDHDMVVLDFIPFEANNTDYPMTEVVERLHNAPHPKLVIAYIDIGQAEDFRTYWQPGWGIGHPEWIVGGDPDGWTGNYPVAYWYEEWREIWLGPDGVLQAILDAGFDGIYLDWVEAYSDENVVAFAKSDGADARQEMIWWVGDMAEFTRAQRPDFIVIGQNAAELAASDEYVNIIDAISQEQVWFDGAADNDPPGDCPLPRTEVEVETEAYVDSLPEPCRAMYEEFPDSTLHVSSEEYLRDLTLAQSKGLVIFTVDYALEPGNVAWVYETSRGLGFVPFVGSRALDQYITPVSEMDVTLSETDTPAAEADATAAETDTSDGDWWQPAVDTTWQWQLLDLPLDQSFDVDMYDIEMFDNDASVVDALHAQDRKVVCYISVGSWEDWRPDKDQFPASVIGKDYGGWPGEKWLDIRQIDLLAPVMRARLDECQAKGFDGIEPDNIDGYTNDTGFPLTYQDQLDYNIWLANEAHARGLSIGLKNDPDQVADLLPYFDWALTEDCFAEGWCEQMLPFIEAGKSVFAAEYTDTGITTEKFCPQAKEMNISAILKNRDLDAWRKACR